MSPRLGAVAQAAAARVPAPLADRLFPGRRREFREAGVTRAPIGERRLFIGPVNSAGQAHEWARAVERLPGVGAASFQYRGADDVFGFPADHVISTTCFVRNSRWRAAQRRGVESGFTHVLVESGRHLFGTEGTVLAQIRALQAAGLTVGQIWHGSDIRLPSQHAAGEPDSPFHPGRYPDTEALETIVLAHRRLIADAGVPQFVSTPDLLEFVPGATWVPVVVDVPRWSGAGARPALRGSRPPVVVHAPTRTGLKGSDRITEGMRALHDEGVIEYRELHGIPSADMPAVFGDADIVLDQFLAGAYGVAASEALAAGRLVVSHVGEDVRAAVAATTGAELPIVQARADELPAVIREIAGDPSRFAVHVEAGPAFVRAVHDGTLSAEALRPFLDA